MLRCKENDIAIVLRGTFTGYFVTVGKFMGTLDTQGYTDREYRKAVRNLWEVSSDTIPNEGRRLVIEDCDLQPIRGRGTYHTTTTEKELRA